MIRLVYKVNGEYYNTLPTAIKNSSNNDFIYLFVGEKSDMPFSGRRNKIATLQWVKDTLHLFGYQWKEENNKEYAI